MVKVEIEGKVEGGNYNEYFGQYYLIAECLTGGYPITVHISEKRKDKVEAMKELDFELGFGLASVMAVGEARLLKTRKETYLLIENPDTMTFQVAGD